MNLITVSTNDEPILRGLLSNRPTTDAFERLIVIDNGCTDGSAAAAAEAGALVVPKQRGGYGSAINLGVTHSEGEFFAMTNPDIRFFATTR